MDIINRLLFALIGFFCGAIVGIVGWWRYGLGFSLRYDGPGVDPGLLNWTTRTGGLFALLALFLRERVGDALGNVLSAIFGFENATEAARENSVWGALLMFALVLILIGFGLRVL